ncbi:MAG TPA: hypothetical protein VFU57_07155 [Candidatus Acidoferrales bacterium]|nr:hypothetical protein [Candidatus Acidoferrales bacterium]
MIENRGQRNSTVNDFQVEVVELNRRFTELTPQDALSIMQGRHCLHGVSSPGISTTGLIKIEAEGATDRGVLTFYIPGVNLRTFAEANLIMDGPERKFPPLHCRLTVTDTTQASATEMFEMHEA